MKKKKLKKELNRTTGRAFKYMKLCESFRSDNKRMESQNEDLLELNRSLVRQLAKRKECCKRLNAERKKSS